ncbi:MAG: GNAT family N-acetyltransferase [Chloroflexi bacterium]|nr:GNAT family N-acetyltransferase [Chloroflexota bacterium]
MMLEGLLVDLVPLNKPFRELEHKWRNHVASWWASGGEWPITTKAALERQQAEWLEWKSNNEGVRGVPFGIQTKDGQPLGYFGINWIAEPHRLAMLGAKIGEPEYWGGGYGTDALLLLVDYAFDWLDIRKCWLMTTSMNDRVQRQMEKVGFMFEVRQRKGALAEGKWYDWLAYGLMREEWPGRAAMLEKLGLEARVKA